jgi:hypothetical protein
VESWYRLFAAGIETNGQNDWECHPLSPYPAKRGIHLCVVLFVYVAHIVVLKIDYTFIHKYVTMTSEIHAGRHMSLPMDVNKPVHPRDCENSTSVVVLATTTEAPKWQRGPRPLTAFIEYCIQGFGTSREPCTSSFATCCSITSQQRPV